MVKKRIKYKLSDKENFSSKIIRETSSKYQKIFLKERNLYLIQGDVLKNNLFNKEFADLIITSPPYNVDIKYNSHKDDISYNEYLEFSEKWMDNCFKWSKPEGRFALNCPLDKNKGGQQSVGADLTTIAKKLDGNIIQQLFGTKETFPEELLGVHGCQLQHLS